MLTECQKMILDDFNNFKKVIKPLLPLQPVMQENLPDAFILSLIGFVHYNECNKCNNERK